VGVRKLWGGDCSSMTATWSTTSTPMLMAAS
jgi:hypothetical protein